MGTKAVKFGGTSLCSAAQMKKAAEIVLSDADRQIVVVSAPGKRFPEDEKITDLLYRCYEETDIQTRTALLDRIRSRFDEIIEELSLPLDFSEEYTMLSDAAGSLRGRDYFVSRGEYLCAKIFAALLGFSFLDAADCILFHDDGSFDAASTGALLSEKLAGRLPVVIPGFYGRMPNDTIKTFPRGGSDITGAIAADAAGVSLYENFTDVSGFLLADPKLVESPKVVDVISYKELRRLSYMGAAVLHEDAVFPVRVSGIPINIRNTDRPDDAGTMIVSRKPMTGSVSGITGRAGYTLIRVIRDRIGEDAAALRTLLAIFERRGIPVFAVPRGVDSVGIAVKSADTEGKKDYILNEICHSVEPETVTLTDGIALVCIVGEHMGAEIPAALFGALATVGERPLLIDSGADDLGITVGIREESLIPVIRQVYHEVLRMQAQQENRRTMCGGFLLFFRNGDCFDLLLFERLIGKIRIDGRDAVQNVKAVRHFAERGILPVEMRRVLVHDKELRTRRIRLHRARHGDDTARVFERIFHAVRRKLPLDLIAGTAHTGAGRITALNHEARNHAVKNQSVIETVICQFHKVRHRNRCGFGIKLQRHHAAVFHFDCRFCHMQISFLAFVFL